MARDIIDVAAGELGYKEGKNNDTKYGKWYGMNHAAWCHMFVSWCAWKAGQSGKVPKTASVSTGLRWFANKGQFKYKGDYTPKRGDIIYFRNYASHVGIVEKVVGNRVHTIEGNSGDKVCRRDYPLNYGTITGYGVPKYKTSSGGSSPSPTPTPSPSGNTNQKRDPKEELAALKKVLDRTKKGTVDTYKGDDVYTNKLPNAKILLQVQNGKKVFEVPVKDELTLTWERKGTPGRLTFEAVYDSKFPIVEGNAVTLTVDGTKLFFGFVFTRKVSKDGWVEYTVYDQLRYLKNKDTRVIKKKRADQIIKKIANDYGLKCGTLANTSYTMSMVEDNVTLFDCIQDALDNTTMQKGTMFVLYDKVGKLTLTKISSMKVNACLIDAETGRDFTYTTSIDNEVYNQIKLIYENKDKGKYEIYMSKHTKNINKWGVLQFVEKIDVPDIGKLKSKCLLQFYNRVNKTLSIEGVIGNPKVRAGSMVPVNLNLNGLKVASYMIVEKVTHRISNNQHIMDLDVSGAGFE